MTSKIKVDNIENQCGGAVVTKCGGTTTISGSVVKSNAIQASDGGNLVSQSGTTITLGASGDTINLASGASQSGFGRTGTVDWDTTPKTATFSAVSGNGYFCNTSGGAFTVNLPAGSAGAIVSLADYAATWQTNNLTVSPNGSEKIGSVNADAVLNTQGQSVTFVYVDSTQGWINTMDSTSNVRGQIQYMIATGGTITTCGNDKIHTFTGPGTFTVCAVSCVCTGRNNVDYLVIAGGGSGQGGYTAGGGGGGAGGFRTSFPSPAGTLPVAAQGYPITVAGGAADGSDGSNSIFSTIISAGGGKGASFNTTANAGGSGGGGRKDGDTPGSAGNTPPVSPPQGNAGGEGQTGGGLGSGGGGGGASGTGSNAGPRQGGNGGSGTANSITGSSVSYAGGGGGGTEGLVPLGGAGGSASSGGGAGSAGGTGNNATANTGGGAGVGENGAGTGGSGIVIIRYKFQ